MRRETKTIIRIAVSFACLLAPVTALSQTEGPRDVKIPNPMGAHTWFIILSVGAFLAWCISYVLELQKERLKARPQRGSLLRQKEELLDHLAELAVQKEAGSISLQRYEKDFRKTKGRLSDVLNRLKHNQDAPES